MRRFKVLRKEIHIQPVYIEADTEQQAIRLVADGNGDYEESEMYYQSTVDPLEWDVEDAKSSDDEWFNEK